MNEDRQYRPDVLAKRRADLLEQISQCSDEIARIDIELKGH
jgi:hypothetical protein